jgi:hypothetical protein
MAGMYMVEGGRLVEFNEKKFDNEKVFQELLAQHPDLLAGELVDPAVPRRWLLVRREPSLRDEEGSLYADHLYLDQDGIPTLVEVKRAADTRTRREVVAQMLDYATRVISLDVRDVQQQFAEWHPNAESDLADFVQGDVDSFWEKVSTNLSAKKIRMLFVADEIPARLRQIIEFLNEQMRPAQVLGIEIRRYETEAREAFVPAVIGRTATAVSRKAASAGTERTVEDFRNLFWADNRPSKEKPEDTARARRRVAELVRAPRTSNLGQPCRRESELGHTSRAECSQCERDLAGRCRAVVQPQKYRAIHRRPRRIRVAELENPDGHRARCACAEQADSKTLRPYRTAAHELAGGARLGH